MTDHCIAPPAPYPTTCAPDSIWTTRQPGTYLLVLYLAEQAVCQVGRFGQFSVQPGWYVYVGSALGGLGGRLRRHARRAKPRHWHIDGLRAATQLVKVAVHVGNDRLECATAARVVALPGATQPIARFGASDCRCPTHLFHFAAEPAVQLDLTWSVTTVVDPE